MSERSASKRHRHPVRMRVLAAELVVLALLVGAACTSSADEPEVRQPRIVDGNGEVQLDAEAVDIRDLPLADGTTSPRVQVLSAWHIAATDAADPVLVEFPWPERENEPAGSDTLVLLRLSDAGHWQPVPAVYDAKNHVLRTITRSFSTWAIARALPAEATPTWVVPETVDFAGCASARSPFLVTTKGDGNDLIDICTRPTGAAPLQTLMLVKNKKAFPVDVTLPKALVRDVRYPAEQDDLFILLYSLAVYSVGMLGDSFAFTLPPGSSLEVVLDGDVPDRVHVGPSAESIVSAGGALGASLLGSLVNMGLLNRTTVTTTATAELRRRIYVELRTRTTTTKIDYSQSVQVVLRETETDETIKYGTLMAETFVSCLADLDARECGRKLIEVGEGLIREGLLPRGYNELVDQVLFLTEQASAIADWMVTFMANTPNPDFIRINLAHASFLDPSGDPLDASLRASLQRMHGSLSNRVAWAQPPVAFASTTMEDLEFLQIGQFNGALPVESQSPWTDLLLDDRWTTSRNILVALLELPPKAATCTWTDASGLKTSQAGYSFGEPSTLDPGNRYTDEEVEFLRSSSAASASWSACVTQDGKIRVLTQAGTDPSVPPTTVPTDRSPALQNVDPSRLVLACPYAPRVSEALGSTFKIDRGDLSDRSEGRRADCRYIDESGTVALTISVEVFDDKQADTSLVGAETIDHEGWSESHREDTGTFTQLRALNVLATLTIEQLSLLLNTRNERTALLLPWLIELGVIEPFAEAPPTDTSQWAGSIPACERIIEMAFTGSSGVRSSEVPTLWRSKQGPITLPTGDVRICQSEYDLGTGLAEVTIVRAENNRELQRFVWNTLFDRDTQMGWRRLDNDGLWLTAIATPASQSGESVVTAAAVKGNVMVLVFRASATGTFAEDDPVDAATQVLAAFIDTSAPSAPSEEYRDGAGDLTFTMLCGDVEANVRSGRADIPGGQVQVQLERQLGGNRSLVLISCAQGRSETVTVVLLDTATTRAVLVEQQDLPGQWLGQADAGAGSVAFVVTTAEFRQSNIDPPTERRFEVGIVDGHVNAVERSS